MSRAVSVDLEAQASLGTRQPQGQRAVARGSDPVNLEGSFPFKLEKRESGYVLQHGRADFRDSEFPGNFSLKAAALTFPGGCSSMES